MTTEVETVGARARQTFTQLRAIFRSNDDTTEDEESGLDTLDVVQLSCLIASLACFFGVLSLPVLFSCVEIALKIISSQYGRDKQVQYLLRAIVGLFATWWIIIIPNAGIVSPLAFTTTICLLILQLQLWVEFRLIIFVTLLVALSGLVSGPTYGWFRFNHSLFVTCAFGFFVVEAELVTRRWSTTQSTARAEVQRAMSKKEELTMEKKGAVTSAVHRLFVKAFGDYDQFSREVSRMVKEVESNMPKETLKLLKEKEVDFSAFELERKLASGGFCTVFRGKWKVGTGGRCAVKSFSSADRLDAAGLRGLVNEVVVLTTLNHKHIVRVLGYCWTPQVCLVMEYMPKGTLHDMLAYKALAISWEAPLLSLAIQIADALAYLHTRNPPIIHRDIKARNILMKDFRTCKLADFGLMVEEGSVQARAGTLRYVAPEVVNRADTSQQNTTRADMWSFGVCLWEMATRAQFQGLPSPYVLFSHSVRSLFVSKLPYKIPTIVYDVIEECLRPDPETRTISAKEAFSRLKSALATLGDEDAWYDEADLPRSNMSAPSEYAPDDLSVDASMSWRADTMWRRTMGNGGNAIPGASISLLDTSKTIDDLSVVQAQRINQRLGRAEANNSRQLAKLNEGLPPPPAQEVEPLPVHHRLGMLSRLAAADTATQTELKVKVTSRQLGDMNDCKLLAVDYEKPPECPAVDESKLASQNVAEQAAVSPDRATRLGLLSRLALAENRTKQEATTKFHAENSSNFDMPVRMNTSGSRLLDSIVNNVEDASEAALGETGEIEIHHRLGLLARIADADADAKHNLVEKIVSQRTLDDSCPLLKSTFIPPPTDLDGEEEHVVVSEEKATQGSGSSFEDRFLFRLGNGSRSSQEDVATSSHDGTTSSFETRLLSRLGNGSKDSISSGMNASSPNYASSSATSNATRQSTTGPSPSSRQPSALTGGGGGGMLSRLAAAENQAAAQLEGIHNSSKVNNSNVPSSVGTRQPLSTVVESPWEGTGDSSGSGLLMSNSGNLSSSSVPPVPPPSATFTQQQRRKIEPLPPPQQPAIPPVAEIRPIAGGLLSRLAAAEAMASSELNERVKSGATSVSSSLLTFPMDEKPEEEEVEDEEDEDEEGDAPETDEEEGNDADSSSRSFSEVESSTSNGGTNRGGASSQLLQETRFENPPVVSIAVLKPLDLLSRLAQAEKLASADLEEKVRSGKTTVSSSLLTFPMDEKPEEEEEEDGEEEEAKESPVEEGEEQPEESSPASEIEGIKITTFTPTEVNIVQVEEEHTTSSGTSGGPFDNVVPPNDSTEHLVIEPSQGEDVKGEGVAEDIVGQQQVADQQQQHPSAADVDTTTEEAIGENVHGMSGEIGAGTPQKNQAPEQQQKEVTAVEASVDKGEEEGVISTTPSKQQQQQLGEQLDDEPQSVTPTSKSSSPFRYAFRSTPSTTPPSGSGRRDTPSPLLKILSSSYADSPADLTDVSRKVRGILAGAIQADFMKQ